MELHQNGIHKITFQIYKVPLSPLLSFLFFRLFPPALRSAMAQNVNYFEKCYSTASLPLMARINSSSRLSNVVERVSNFIILEPSLHFTHSLLSTSRATQSRFEGREKRRRKRSILLFSLPLSPCALFPFLSLTQYLDYSCNYCYYTYYCFCSYECSRGIIRKINAHSLFTSTTGKISK